MTTDPIGPRTPAALRPRTPRAAIAGAESGRECTSPKGSRVRADPVGRQQLHEQAMQAFVGELRATSPTSVAVATPPIPAPARTTAPGASSGQRRRLSSCGARVVVIAVGLAAVLAFALTPNAAAPIRDIRAVALELPAPRAARPASVVERAVRRSVRRRWAPAAGKPRHSAVGTRRAARGTATARPVSSTVPPAGSLAGARSSSGSLSRTSAPLTAARSSVSEFLP